MIRFNDLETARQQRNLTSGQKRNNSQLKEGVIANKYITDTGLNFQKTNLDETLDTLLISGRPKLPHKLIENQTSPESDLLPISGVAVGGMSLVTALTWFAKRNAKIANTIAKEKWITSFTRNISINEETVQALVQMVQNPNKKTLRAGLGVLTLTATAFMGKTFLDGFKEVWVKRKEADIQKDLQENLIEVETQAFAGKIQIIRNKLSETAALFSKYLEKHEYSHSPFGMFKTAQELNFSGRNSSENKQNPLKYYVLGALSFASIIALSWLSFKNLRDSGKEVKKYIQVMENELGKIAQSKEPKPKVEEYLSSMLQAINANRKTVEEIVNKTDWSPNEKEMFIEQIVQKIETSTVKVNPNIAGDGTPKPSFSSFVDDYRAFFYNFLIEPDNKQFQQLFYGTTALAGLSYGGKLLGDAIKEVQVKKINAQTELSLQRRLVSTELRNFKSKKDAATKPLIDEFFRKVESGNPPEVLKSTADNILFEIKNGPPFVYS